jgi:hypothetical protein
MLAAIGLYFARDNRLRSDDTDALSGAARRG